MKRFKKTRAWYLQYETWLWRGTLAIGVMASLYLNSKYVTQETFWKMYRDSDCRIKQTEKDIEILKERTHR